MSRATAPVPADLLRRLRFAFLAAAFGWFSLLSWAGLLDKAYRVFDPAFFGACLIALIGGVLRWRRVRWQLVLLAQIVVLGTWLQSRTSAHSGLRAWVPTPSGLHRLISTVHEGAVEVNRYASPVAAAQVDAVEYFLVLGLVVVLAVDLIAGGFGQASWSALPVVVALSIPVSVLDQGLPWAEFCGCALLFVMLLASEEMQRVRSWSSTGAGRTPGGRFAMPWPSEPAPARGTAAGLGVLATVGALVLPLLIPVGDGLISGSHGSGHGGSSDSITLVNPVVDLHRELVEGGQVPLVIANTDDPDREYLRLTVLDAFDGTQWQPSKRSLAAANRVNGPLPAPPGLDVGTQTTSAQWSLEFTSAFRSSWLAAPYPLKSLVTRGGDWRFDSRTMDFVRVDHQRLPPVSYQLTTLDPVIDSGSLAAAAPAPAPILQPMTALPAGVSPLVKQIALQVTAGATNDYDRMVRLQDWFRSAGGFTYSLIPDRGNSADALVRFITTDKVGFCEQFAAAMAVMARTLGVPSRVVVGFLRPDSVRGGQATYTADDLHAWPEIYFQGAGWVRFEPTPATRTGAAPPWTLKQTLPRPTSSALPQKVPTPKTTAHRPVLPDAATPTTHSSGSGQGWLLVVFSLVLLASLSLPALVRRRARARRLGPKAGSERDRLAAETWTELLATAADLRVDWPRGRSIRVVAEVLARTVMPEPADLALLHALVADLEEARYGPPGPAEDETVEQMRAAVRRWSHLLAASVPRRRRWAALLLPRSVLVRAGALLPPTAEPSRADSWR